MKESERGAFQQRHSNLSESGGRGNQRELEEGPPAWRGEQLLESGPSGLTLNNPAVRPQTGAVGVKARAAA